MMKKFEFSALFICFVEMLKCDPKPLLLKMRSKTSKCDSKYQRAIRKYKPKLQSKSCKVKVQAKTSKSQPKHESASQNIEMQVKPVKCKLKQ